MFSIKTERKKDVKISWSNQVVLLKSIFWSKSKEKRGWWYDPMRKKKRRDEKLTVHHECDFDVRIRKATYVHFLKIFGFKNDHSQLSCCWNVSEGKTNVSQLLFLFVFEQHPINMISVSLNFNFHLFTVRIRLKEKCERNVRWIID